MKNRKLVFACLIALLLTILAILCFLITMYLLGHKNYTDIKNAVTGEDETNETDDTAEEETGQIPGDAGENDPNAGNGTDLVTMDDGTQYQIFSPVPDGVISSPLTVSGQVSGTWYFEGSFQIELRDYDGNVIATGIATAQSDWMSEELVEYEGTLTFTAPAGEIYGELYLLKENPSGLIENDNQISYPVRF
ncbi:hypothetical protein JW978_02125 [Candidatus Dojkabacteria bacterium]|nr:hypothetical protein [Candidatus Dojkabacteria bacterium]